METKISLAYPGALSGKDQPRRTFDLNVPKDAYDFQAAFLGSYEQAGLDGLADEFLYAEQTLSMDTYDKSHKRA